MSDCAQSFDVKMKRPKEFRMAELFIEEGTKDHSLLENRESADQHPIEAITGLREELDSKATISPVTATAGEIMVYSEDGTLGCCGHTMEDLVLKSDISDIQCYKYFQETPSKQWVINHNLNRNPSATIVNKEGKSIIGEITYVDFNNMIIEFSTEISGSVCLN